MGLEVDGVSLGFEEGNGGGVVRVRVCCVDSEVVLEASDGCIGFFFGLLGVGMNLG